MKRHLISLILTVVLVVGGVNVIPAGTKDVSAAMQLNDFESYYSRDLGQTENLLGTVSKEEKWNIDENGVITDTNSTWWNSGDELWKDMSVLKYNISQYKDFTLTVDFKNHIRGDYEEDGVTKKDNWEMRYGAFVGFGIENNGSDITGWNGDNTGIIIKPYGTNSIKLAGSFDDINSGTHQSATQYDTTIDGVDIANEDWHTMKLEVKAGIIKITVDEQQAWPTQPLGYSDWYEGGYVVIGSNNGGTQFKNIQISEVKKPSVLIDGLKVEIRSDGKVTLGDAKYGYLCDGKMYAPNTTVEVVDGMTFKSVNELSVTMADGAGIRYKGNEKGTGGIRFQASIESDNMDAVASSAITEGTLITANDIYEAFEKELTLTYSHDKINVKNSGWFNGKTGTYCGSICRVNELNYIRDFTARAYVTVNYENADAVTIYSSMGPERNISDIAKEIKRQEYPGIAEEYWSVIDSFIKK